MEGKINLKQQKILIFIIIVAVVTLYFGKKISSYHNTKLAAIKEKIEIYRNKIELINGVIRLSQELEKFKDIGWLTNESVAVMGKINELVTKYGIEIITFDPGGLSDKGNYFTLLMSLNIKTDYFTLLRFITAIENLQSLTKITNLQIIPDGDSSQEQGPISKVNLTLEAFIIKK
jgi:Tfp pilus assembly protein PilO